MHRVAREMHFLWHAIYNGLGDGTTQLDLSQAVTVSEFDKSSKYGPPMFLAGSSWISVLKCSLLECNKTTCDSHPELSYMDHHQHISRDWLHKS